MNRDEVLRRFAGTWAILPSSFDVLVLHALAGEVASESAIARDAGRMGSIAVLPLHGPISQRGSFLSLLFGCTSVEAFSAAFRQVIMDDAVSAVVLDVDSPGGTVNGITELADELHAARGAKPIVAVANTLAASAAYWLATQADEVVVMPSAEVGSIGVFAVHQDFSRMLDAAGVATTLIAAGTFKTEANPFEPLGEEARAAIQERVDDYYSQFVAAVARGRGVSAAAVRGGFGEGRLVGARDAVALGMADRVGTMSDTLRRLGNPRERAWVGRRRSDIAVGGDMSGVREPDLSPSGDEGETAGAHAEIDRRRRRLRLLAARGGSLTETT